MNTDRGNSKILVIGLALPILAFKDLHKGHEAQTQRGTKARSSRRQGIRTWGPRSRATGQGGGGWTGFLGPQPAATPLGMPVVSPGAFVCSPRPQGVFVSFVESLFSGVWPMLR